MIRSYPSPHLVGPSLSHPATRYLMDAASFDRAAHTWTDRAENGYPHGDGMGRTTPRGCRIEAENSKRIAHNLRMMAVPHGYTL